MAVPGIAYDTPAPPYYAVIFTSQRVMGSPSWAARLW